MDVSPTLKLQNILDRLRGGDPSARQELIASAYERLRLLARKLLHEDFPRLQQAHATGSILDEAAIRLLGSLGEVTPPTVADFFRFSAMQMRRVLIDMARQHDRREERAPPAAASSSDEESLRAYDPADSTYNPARLAVWTEFHVQVDALPDDERQVMDLCWYQGLTQQEAAEAVGVSQKEISRRWIRARLKLLDLVSGLREFL